MSADTTPSLPPPIVGPADQMPHPYPPTDDCLSSGTTRWTVMPCVPVTVEVTVVTEPHVVTQLPATGGDVNGLTAAVLVLLLGVVARRAARR